jgi:ribonuclease P protein component
VLAFCFYRHLRLNQAEQFKETFSSGKKRVDNHAVFYVKSNQLEHPRLGMVIAKKHVPKAVSRNRIKRAIRETFRQNQHNLPKTDIVIVARNRLGQLDKTGLHKCLNKLWQDVIATHKKA